VAAAPVAASELPGLFSSLVGYDPIILAVSGGADSMALMHLVARWSKTAGGRGHIVVATVDHGLRAGSRKEAEWVCAEAHALGLQCELLVWEGAKPQTGIQDAARAARYRLLGALAVERSAGEKQAAVVTAHTQDDQAETFLMRLARGSGLDGLTGMSTARELSPESEVQLVRPLLGISGDGLRATLRAQGRHWIEDPSNASERFERVRLRKARTDLVALGLSNDKIALSARRLERARLALEAGTDRLERETRLDLHAGAYGSFQLAEFLAAPEELSLRMLARLIAAYGGGGALLSLAKVEQLLVRIGQPEFRGATLAGAAVALRAARRGGEPATVLIFREPGRSGMPQCTLEPGGTALWDGRFYVSLAHAARASVSVRALGSSFPEVRRSLKGRTLPPARAGATLPSFWAGGKLIAVAALEGECATSFIPQGGLCSASFAK
jgi:tRNA(Ile)-lysidine synthase